MSERTYTPGPAGDEVLQEDMKVGGTMKLEEGDDQVIDPRLLKREQLVEITLLGYITGINEVTKTVDKREGTVRVFTVGAYRLKDVDIIAQPAARPRRNGAPPILPGQTSLTKVIEDAAPAIEDQLRSEGFDVTVSVGDPQADGPPAVTHVEYPRASLNVGEGANGRVLMDAATGELVTLDAAQLPDGPWNLPSGDTGYVCGLLDPDTAAFASDGRVLAVPTDHFMASKLLEDDAPPPPPAEVADPPPTDAERRADDDNGPLAPGTDPADTI